MAFRWGNVDDTGVPPWWPHFCLAFDLVAAALMTISQAVHRRR